MHRSFPGEGGKSNPGCRNSIKDGSEVRKKRERKSPSSDTDGQSAPSQGLSFHSACL